MSSIAVVSDVVRFWDFSDDSLSHVTSCTPPCGILSDACWNHTNQVLAVGGSGPKICLVQASNGNVLSHLPYSDENEIFNDLPVSSLSFSSSSRYLAAGADANVYIWDLKQRSSKWCLEGHTNKVSSVQFLHDSHVVAGDHDGAVCIWSVKDGESIKSLVCNEAVGRCHCVQLANTTSAAGRVVSGYEDGSLCLWEVESGSRIRRMNPWIQGSVRCISTSPKNSRLVAVGNDMGKVSLLDTTTKATVNNIDKPSATIDLPHSPAVTSMSFHENALQIAVGTSGGDVFIYDWRNVRVPVCCQTDQSPAQAPIKSVCFQHGAVKGTSSNNSVASNRTGTNRRPPVANSVPPTSPKPPSRPSLATSSTVPVLTTTVSHPPVVKAQPISTTGRLDKDEEDSVVSDVSSLTHATIAVPSSTAVAPQRSATGSDAAGGGAVASVPHDPVASAHANSDPSLAHKAVANSNVTHLRNTLSPKHTKASSTVASKEGTITVTSTSSANPRAPAVAPGTSMGVSVSTALVPPSATHADTPVHGHAAAVPHSHTPTDQRVPHQRVPDLTPPLQAEEWALLKYDIHCDITSILREQTRQFALQKDDLTDLIHGLSQQLHACVQGQEQLRVENDKLRQEIVRLSHHMK